MTESRQEPSIAVNDPYCSYFDATVGVWWWWWWWSYQSGSHHTDGNKAGVVKGNTDTVLLTKTITGPK